MASVKAKMDFQQKKKRKYTKQMLSDNFLNEWSMVDLVDFFIKLTSYKKIVNEYGQEIPQSQTADNPMTPWGWAAQPSRDTRKTN